LKAASTEPDGDVCPPDASGREGRGVAEGVACVVAGFVTVRGVGEGLGGAIVRVRVDGPLFGSMVELLLFCASPETAHKQVIDAATRNFFILISFRFKPPRHGGKEILNHKSLRLVRFFSAPL
jgi:hypothetical protein